MCVTFLWATGYLSAHLNYKTFNLENLTMYIYCYHFMRLLVQVLELKFNIFQKDSKTSTMKKNPITLDLELDKFWKKPHHRVPLPYGAGKMSHQKIIAAAQTKKNIWQFGLFLSRYYLDYLIVIQILCISWQAFDDLTNQWTLFDMLKYAFQGRVCY